MPLPPHWQQSIQYSFLPRKFSGEFVRVGWVMDSRMLSVVVDPLLSESPFTKQPGILGLIGRKSRYFGVIVIWVNLIRKEVGC
jgi:hypothetical protein